MTISQKELKKRCKKTLIPVFWDTLYIGAWSIGKVRYYIQKYKVNHLRLLALYSIVLLIKELCCTGLQLKHKTFFFSINLRMNLTLSSTVLSLTTSCRAWDLGICLTLMNDSCMLRYLHPLAVPLRTKNLYFYFFPTAKVPLPLDSRVGLWWHCN